MEDRKPRPEPERKFKFKVDNKDFEQTGQFITGAQIKALVNAPANYGVWLVIPGPAEDNEIGDAEKADLGRPGVEKFITGPKQTTEGDHELSS
jgi:hypothetical protein